jgi:dipeptide/tripeptide permease
MSQENQPNAVPDYDAPDAPAVPTSHPPGFWFFFWGELAERCSYYGMNAILTLYLVDMFMADSGLNKADADAKASAWVNYFIAGCYLAPLLGGFIADRFLGKYRTIVMFSIPYVIGNALMIIPLMPALVGALIILAMGSGVIKPNISTLMGMTYDQQRPGQDQLRSSAFSWFYFAINIGSMISMFFMPRLRDEFGANNAFWLPTILMAVALTIFALGKRYYAVETLVHHEKTPEEKAAQWQAVGRLMGVFILMTVFWGIFKHYPSVWVHFTNEKIDTYVFGKVHKGDAFQFLNALFIITLLPTSMYVYSQLAKRGITLRPTDKMQLGFLFTLLTPLTFIVCDSIAGSDGKAHWAWIVLCYLMITIAEVLISPVGLELAFVAAPKSLKGFITACFLFTIFIASMINAQVTPLYSKVVDGVRFCTPSQYFGVQAAVAAAAFVAFYFVAKPFNRKMAEQAT